jgi:hypothetical protein
VYSGLKSIFDFAVGIIISVYILYSKGKFLRPVKKMRYRVFKVKKVNSILPVSGLPIRCWGVLSEILSRYRWRIARIHADNALPM